MLILTVAGLGSAAYTHWGLGYPLLPGEVTTVWTVEAKVTFEATGEPVLVSLNLPDSSGKLVAMDAKAASPGHGFHRVHDRGETRGIWARATAKGPQTLYYRIQVYRQLGGYPEPAVDAPPPEMELDEAQQTAAKTLTEVARERSADTRTFTLELVRLLICTLYSGYVTHHFLGQSNVAFNVKPPLPR